MIASERSSSWLRRGVLSSAVELARRREKPVVQIARDLGIGESGLRRWMRQPDVDDGDVEGLSTDKRKALFELRRKNRVENEILKRASACFARENVLPE